MDSSAFPPAIVACWIIVVVIGYGMRLHKEEMSTGLEPKAVTPFVFGCIALMGALWWVEMQYEVLFVAHLTSILIGALIGLGTAYFALRLVAALRRARSQSRQRNQ